MIQIWLLCCNVADISEMYAAELGAACDSLAEDMFESEFLVQ